MKKFTAVLLVFLLLITMFASCAQESGEDNSWEYIKNKGVLIVGLDDTFCPMGFRNEKNELVGFDIDFANAVGEELGVKIEFQPIDWDSKDFELNNKNIDCIWNGMSRNPEREAQMTLTKNYIINRIVILGVEGKIVTELEDLKNYQIGTQAQSAALQILKNCEIYEEIKDNIYEYKTYDEVIMDMDAGRIDVMVVDEVLGEYKSNMRSEKFVLSPYNFGDDYYVVGLRKNNESLRDELEKAFDAVKAGGKAAELSQTWFGKDILAY